MRYSSGIGQRIKTLRMELGFTQPKGLEQLEPNKAELLELAERMSGDNLAVLLSVAKSLASK